MRAYLSRGSTQTPPLRSLGLQVVVLAANVTIGLLAGLPTSALFIGIAVQSLMTAWMEHGQKRGPAPNDVTPAPGMPIHDHKWNQVDGETLTLYREVDGRHFCLSFTRNGDSRRVTIWGQSAGYHFETEPSGQLKGDSEQFAKLDAELRNIPRR